MDYILSANSNIKYLEYTYENEGIMYNVKLLVAPYTDYSEGVPSVEKKPYLIIQKVGDLKDKK